MDKAARISNLRMIMKKAHELCKYTIQKGDNYHVTLGLCIKVVAKQVKEAKKRNALKTTKQYLGGRRTTSQYNTIMEMRNVLGSHWEGLKGTYENLSNVQASYLIQSNMEQYKIEKAQNFCTVRQYQKLIQIKKSKKQGEMKLERRQITKEQASNWLKQYGVYGGMGTC